VWLSGCSAALMAVTAEQAEGLKDAQRIANEVTRAYGVPRVRVYAAGARPGAGGAYSYRYDWIFIRPELLTGNLFWIVLGHELGHATLGHRPVDGQREQVRATMIAREAEANRRGVEIMVRFGGMTEREALDLYATYFIEDNLRRDGRNDQVLFGHQMPCDELRELWTSFGRTAPPCEAFTDAPRITHCPYDDWMSTGCKAGELLEPSRLP
jgi:hypothetical protein